MADSVIIIFGKNTRPFHTWAAKWQTEIWYACETRILTATGQGAGWVAVARAGVWGHIDSRVTVTFRPGFSHSKYNRKWPCIRHPCWPYHSPPGPERERSRPKTHLPLPQEKKKKGWTKKRNEPPVQTYGCAEASGDSRVKATGDSWGERKNATPGEAKNPSCLALQRVSHALRSVLQVIHPGKSYTTFWKQLYHQY